MSDPRCHPIIDLVNLEFKMEHIGLIVMDYGLIYR